MNTRKYSKDLFEKAKNKLNFPRYRIDDFWKFCPYSISKLSSKTRKQEIVIWRDLGIFIHYCELKNQEKAGAIFNRDRSIIPHIMQKIIYSDTNVKFKESVKKLKSDIMESRIFVVKKNGKLIPSMEQDKEKINVLSNNSVYEIKVSKPRNYKFLQKFFVLCKIAFDNQESYKSFEHFRHDLTVECGFYDVRYNEFTGEQVKRAKSISFSRMTEIEFSEFFNRFVETVCFIWGFDEDVFLEEIEERTQKNF